MMSIEGAAPNIGSRKPVSVYRPSAKTRIGKIVIIWAQKNPYRPIPSLVSTLLPNLSGKVL